MDEEKVLHEWAHREAINHICPRSQESITIYEHNSVKTIQALLMNAGRRLLALLKEADKYSESDPFWLAGHWLVETTLNDQDIVRMDDFGKVEL